MAADIIFSELKISRPYGIEIEVGREMSINQITSIISDHSDFRICSNLYKHTINNNYWDIKLDGSCGNNEDEFGINEGGYEINSFKANNLDHLLHICEIVKKIGGAGACVNKNCGLHIHVDASDFSYSDMGRLIASWLCIEKTMLNAVPKRRVYNRHCLPWGYLNLEENNKIIAYKVKNYIDIWEKYKSPVTSLSTTNAHRKKTLNLVNYCRFKKVKNYRRGTVEFRFPEGTLVPDNIKYWTILFLTFVDKCKRNPVQISEIESSNLNKTLEIIGFANNMNIEKFCILDNNLYKAKIWFLKRILRYGSRFYKKEALSVLKDMGVSQ